MQYTAFHGHRALACWGLAAALAACLGCGPAEEVAEVKAVPAAGGAVEIAARPRFPAASASDWPWWRGTRHDGHAADVPDGAPPLKWSETENILWKTDVPGRGHATPTVWGEQIFVSTADDDAETISLLCYDRDTGEPRWSTKLHEGGFMHRHEKNSHASGTPACDGERVYVAHMVSHEGQDGIWVSAVDLDGNVVWQQKAGPFTSRHGYGSAPLVYRDTLIVGGDNGENGFLAALDRDSGKVRWRIRRPAHYNFSTPVVAEVAGRDQLLVHGAGEVASYDPATGEEWWHCDGPAETCANTVCFDADRVYASGGWPDKRLLAIRGDGSGDVTGSHVVWEKSKSICYVPSMLLADGLLYGVSDNGVATCYDATTGQEHWVKRLGGDFSASPVLAAGCIYLPDEDGLVHVLRAGATFEPVAENDLGDGGFASPVIIGDTIYLRTLHHLYAIRDAG
ncbi:MAG: PQQ-binding-like beta-propeller repeat protein [Pirellulales bacterium]